MNNKQTNQLYRYCNALITIFTDYVIVLDSYFSIPENRKNNEFLYDEYRELGKRLKGLEEKYKRWIY